MTRRKPKNGNGDGSYGFNLATVAQMLFIPILTVGIGLSGFYYLTKDTLARHEAAITSTIPSEFKNEADAREKTRNEFLDKIAKLSDGVSNLNTNVALQTQALQQLKDELHHDGRH